MFLVQDNTRSWFLYLILMCVLAGLLHSNTPDLLLDADDRDYFFEAAVSLTDLSNLFSPDRRPSAIGRPVIDVVFLANYAFWKTNHIFYHYQVVATHLGASLLMALVCFRLGASLQSAFLGGLFFLIHVAHFRAVHWIASIGYPLSLVFGFLVVLSHHSFLNGRKLGKYIGAVSLSMAILTHPSAVSIFPFCIYVSWRRIGSFLECVKNTWHLGFVSVLCLGLCYGLYPQSTQVTAVDSSFKIGMLIETLTWHLSRLITAPHWLLANLHPEPAAWELIVGGAGILVLFYLWWRGPESVRIFAVFTVIAILPFFNAKPGFRWTPAGPSRHLYFSAVGTSFLLSYFLVWAGENLKQWIGQTKGGVVMIAAIVGIIGISIFNSWRTQAISYYASGRTYFAQQEIDLGMMQLEKAIRRSPTVAPPDTYFRLAMMFFSQNRSPEHFLNIGRDLYPLDVDLMFVEGFWESEQADLEVREIGQAKMNRALELAVNKKALKLNAAVAYHNLASYFNNQGNYTRAIRLLNQALIFNPQYFSAVLNLGKVLRKAGDTDEALKIFQRAIDVDSEHEEPYRYISEILFEKAHFEAARRVAELIVQFAPESIDAHYLIAMSMYAEGNFAQSVQHFQKVVELAPDHEMAKQALQSIAP